MDSFENGNLGSLNPSFDFARVTLVNCVLQRILPFIFDNAVHKTFQPVQCKKVAAANLELTDEQATKFWPVYDQYSAELTKIGDQKTALIKQYADQWNTGTKSDEQASNLIKRSLAVDEQVTQLRVKYMPIFSNAVPGKVVATFFQLDRWIQALIDLQSLATI